MGSEFHANRGRSALEIMETARDLQAGHGTRLLAHAAESLRRIVSRMMGESARDAA